MPAPDTLPRCPICGDVIQESPRPLEQRFDASRCKCKRCGNFDYSEFALSTNHFNEVKHLVSAWIRRQNKAGIAHPFVAQGSNAVSIDNWFQNLYHLGFPQTISEKQDALLYAVADILKDEIWGRIEIEQCPYLISDIAAKNINEVRAVCQLLHQRNFIDFSGSTGLTVKASGWDRIDQLRKSNTHSDSAFVALWYDSCTEKYREATVAAVRYCGYKPLIVDQVDFNGFIMDQIISLIRQSRFIIADFTCRAETQGENNLITKGIRGGVYWEAGMAYGMGKSVIHTCEDVEEAKNRIHFDLKQYKTIFWNNEELSTTIRELSGSLPNPNFAERLSAHILATVGKGNYQSS